MKRFRSIRSKLGPPWLVELGDSGKVAHTIAGICDAFLERVRLGLEARFPARAGDSALALLGRDRLLPRGRRETAEGYAARLKGWRYPYGHRVRGSAFSLLDQVSAFLGSVLTLVIDDSGPHYEPAFAPVRTVDARGTVFARNRSGDRSVTRGGAWTWDSQPSTNWSRFWILIDATGVQTVDPQPARTTIPATNPQAYDVTVLAGELDWEMVGGTIVQNTANTVIPAGGTVDLEIATDDAGSSYAIREDLFVSLVSGNPHSLSFWYGGVPEAYGSDAQFLEGSVLATPSPDSEHPDFWSHEDQAIGFDGLTASDARALRGLVTGRGAWKPAGTRPEWLVLSLDGSWPEPDSTWEHWSITSAGVIFPARNSSFRYVSLSPTINNVYAGDSSNYPVVFAVHGFDGDEGLTPFGDDSSYPATITLSNGSTYAGNSATFPTTIQLIDDGDLVP